MPNYNLFVCNKQGSDFKEMLFFSGILKRSTVSEKYFLGNTNHFNLIFIYYFYKYF